MANLAQIIPALFVKDGELLTPEQIKRRQALSANALAFATDTSPNAGGVASILAKGLAGFRSGWEENRANAALEATGKENQSLISSLLGGLGSTGGVGQSATVGAPTVAPMQNIAPAATTQAAPETVDLSGDKQSFINTLLPAAIEEGARTGVDPRIIVAQAAQETGWGRSAPGNNYFGIKSHGQSGGQNLTTHEVINGQRVKINDSFRTFGSPEDSVRGYGDFILNNKRYQPLREAQGLDNQLAALQASGYATDPNYSRSVGAIARSIQLPQGQSASQPQAQPSTGVNPAIIAALSSPVSNEQTRSVASLLLNNQLSQQQAAQELALKQQQQQQAIAQRQSIAQSMGINPSAALDDNAWKAAVEAANRGRQTATVNGVVLDVNTGQPIFQAPQQPTTGIQDYNFYAESERQAGRQPLGPLEYEQALRSAGASRTNIDTGTVPQGYQAIRDEQGRLIRYDPVPGGPADTTKTQEKAQANTQRSSNIVLEDVDRAVSAIESNPALTTGIIGNWSRGIGGTPANKVQNLLQTVRANSAFDRLQQMREASPTGGALGAVSDSELGLLQNAIGSLEQSNNSEDLVYNLRRVQRIYEDIINGPDAAKKMREERSKASESASQPAQGWKDLGNGIKIRPKGSN